MPWFKVDDHFHSHRKTLATSPAALGLWVVAGSWAAANPDDGFVPAYVLPRLLADAESLADELVERGLWQRVKGGFKFRNWTEYQFTKEEIEQTRIKARERQRKRRAKQNGLVSDDNVTPESQRESRRDTSVSHTTHTQPNPTQPNHLVEESSVRSSPDVPRELPDGNDVRSKPVNVQAAIVSREYTDRVKLADRAKVAGVVQQAIDGGYEQTAIKAALRRLAKDSRPVTPDTLRIEIDGKGAPVGREPKQVYTPPRGGQRGREGW